MLSDADTKLLGLIKTRYEAAAKSQKQVVTDMEHGRLFYRGNQWLKWDSKWIPASKKAWKVRLTINTLPPAVEGNIAVYMRASPIIIARPHTDDEDDRQTAKVSEQILRAHFQNQGLIEQEIEMLTWKFTAGNGFLSTYWDSTAGKRIAIYEQEEMKDESGLPVMDPEAGMPVSQEVYKGSRPEGATVVKSVDPFSVSVEPGATNFEDAGWVIVTEFMRRDVIEERFGKKIEDTPETDDKRAQSTIYTPAYVHAHMKPTKERVPVHIMYERPTKKNSDGRLVYATTAEILYKGKLPEGQIRIVHFRNIRLPGELWATSICRESIPLQYELNRARSQIIENRNLSSRPKLIAVRGSMELDEITSEPGEIVEYDQIGVSEPHWLTPPSIPGYVERELAWIRQDLDDISSRHEASQGRMSSQIKSGVQAESFRQADASRHLPGILSFEHGLSKVGKYVLLTEKENKTGESILSIVGKGLEHEVVKFESNDINDASNIFFQIASQWPWARDQLRRLTIERYQMGLITADHANEQLDDVPTPPRIYETNQDNKRNAEMENDMLMQGIPFDPIATDDHRVHNLHHGKAANRPEIRQQILQNREVLNALNAHMQGHQEMITPPQPPPIATKANLNIAAMLKSLLEAGQGEFLMPYIEQMLSGMTGQVAPQTTPEEPSPDGGRGPGMPQAGMEGQPPSPAQAAAPPPGAEGGALGR